MMDSAFIAKVMETLMPWLVASSLVCELEYVFESCLRHKWIQIVD